MNLKSKSVILVGTAHISQESVAEVKKAIEENSPDCVAVELDSKRAAAIKEPKKYQELNIIKVLTSHEGLFLLCNLVLSSYQKRLGINTGSAPGTEMLTAMNEAEEKGITVLMCDRPLNLTLKRAWRINGFIDKIKLLSYLVASSFDTKTVSSEEVERLKNKNEMDALMQELSLYLPKIKQVLIDERDFYLASKIYKAEGNKTLAVLGAGHIAGVTHYLNEFDGGKEAETSNLETLPKKSVVGKVIGWIIPILIVGLIAAGFYFGGRKKALDMSISWVLWNGGLAALGAIFALANPLTILASFLAAPLTSLCPLIGVGIVSGIVQALVHPPKVKDLSKITEDTLNIKGFYKNRVLKVLVVFILTSIGSSIGTFIGGANVIAKLASIFR